MRVASFAVIASIALATVVACGNKAQECKAVIDTIDDDDAALKGIDLDTENYPQLSKNLKSAADIVDKVGTDLAGKTVKDAELAKASGDYQAFSKSLATELRSFADLVAKLSVTLDKAGPMAKSLTSGLDKLQTRCHAADKSLTADCAAIAKAMKDAPDQDAFKFDKDLKDDAAAFAKFAAELKGLALTDKDLKGDLDEVAKGIGALEEIMRGLSDLKPSFDASHTSLKAILAKEAPIERHINETCAAK